MDFAVEFLNKVETFMDIKLFPYELKAIRGPVDIALKSPRELLQRFEP